ncbi:DDE superfamily endonuclease [Popillia japonica]|uniref:DDE superfamily endonuclease n=1 Tax=Popillia japonica TaxID=7064 RepID=A0AAW1LUP9_POPJA
MNHLITKKRRKTDEDDAVRYRSEDSDTVQDANSSSDTDSDNIIPAKRQRTLHFLGKDANSSSDTDSDNIIPAKRQRTLHFLGTKGSAENAKSPLDCWKLFFGDPIVEIVVENTNKYIAANFERYGRDRDCKVTDKAEIEALLGLLYLAGLLKSSRLNVDELWDRRFLFLLRHLGFDDFSTRATRKQTDKLARIRKLFDEFTRNRNTCLVGDSGYPHQPWLMTPILHANEGTPEFRYTERQIQARNCIERCFGILKRRFRCLLKERVLRYDPQKARLITNVCAILHNICVEAQIPNNFEVPHENNILLASNDDVQNEGHIARQNLIRHYSMNRK